MGNTCRTCFGKKPKISSSKPFEIELEISTTTLLNTQSKFSDSVSGPVPLPTASISTTVDAIDPVQIEDPKPVEPPLTPESIIEDNPVHEIQNEETSISVQIDQPESQTSISSENENSSDSSPSDIYSSISDQNENIYPTKRVKQIEIVMLNEWHRFKRHYKLFHYTSRSNAQSILNSGYIRAGRARVQSSFHS